MNNEKVKSNSKKPLVESYTITDFQKIINLTSYIKDIPIKDTDKIPLYVRSAENNYHYVKDIGLFVDKNKTNTPIIFFEYTSFCNPELK